MWLDTLWIQVSGTLCNIACRHCLVSAGPKVDRHRMLSADEVVKLLDDCEGVREIWLTGGEPFLNPEILAILDACLERAAVGVLTNGMRIDEPMARALGARFREAAHNLEIRVSLDGQDAAANDAIRGRGAFLAAMGGISRLVTEGVEPIVAVTGLEPEKKVEEFHKMLRLMGVSRPRVKWIPPFKVGREVARGGGYAPFEGLNSAQVEEPEAPHRLQCGTSRTVTSQGVFPCPILIDEPSFLLGARVSETLVPHPVDHPACST